MTSNEVFDDGSDIKEKKRLKMRETKLYFSMDTQDAIIRFQAEEDEDIKSKIYELEILPAFDKLAENLIFMYGFTGIENYDTLKSDCVTFLYEKLPKYDHTKGHKAFSYFNVVAKHWLIIRAKSRTTMLKRSISIDDNVQSVEARLVETDGHKVTPDRNILANERTQEITKLLLKIKSRVNNENELRCIDAIITLFNNIDKLDFLNKRAVFVYLRELSGLDPKKLTVAMSVIKRHYKKYSNSDDFNIF